MAAEHLRALLLKLARCKADRLFDERDHLAAVGIVVVRVNAVVPHGFVSADCVPAGIRASRILCLRPHRYVVAHAVPALAVLLLEKLAHKRFVLLIGHIRAPIQLREKLIPYLLHSEALGIRVIEHALHSAFAEKAEVAEKNVVNDVILKQMLRKVVMPYIHILRQAEPSAKPRCIILIIHARSRFSGAERAVCRMRGTAKIGAERNMHILGNRHSLRRSVISPICENLIIYPRIFLVQLLRQSVRKIDHGAGIASGL